MRRSSRAKSSKVLPKVSEQETVPEEATAPVSGEMDWKSTIAGARFDYEALNAADAWYRYGGTKWDLSSYLRAEYALSPRWMLYADLQLRNVDYILAGRDDKASTINASTSKGL